MPNSAQLARYADLAVLVAIARGGSLIGAARALRLPPTTVSRRLAALEQALGLPLVRRSTRRIALTPEAQILVDRAAGAFDDLDDALSELAPGDGRLRGVLKVTAPVIAGREIIGPQVAEFARRHPGLKIDLLLSNTVVDLIEAGFDLAFRLGPFDGGHQLIVRRLWDVPYRLYAAADIAPLSHPEDLVRQPCVVSPPMETWRFVGPGGAMAAVTPAPALRVNDLSLGLAAVASGLGLGLFPASLAERAAEPLVAVDIPGWRPVERTMLAVFPPGRQRSPKARALVDHILAQRTSTASRIDG